MKYEDTEIVIFDDKTSKLTLDEISDKMCLLQTLAEVIDLDLYKHLLTSYIAVKTNDKKEPWKELSYRDDDFIIETGRDRAGLNTSNNERIDAEYLYPFYDLKDIYKTWIPEPSTGFANYINSLQSGIHTLDDEYSRFYLEHVGEDIITFLKDIKKTIRKKSK